jgi:sigma-B regulation protein RsbU (phosphoserine phosphatase)
MYLLQGACAALFDIGRRGPEHEEHMSKDNLTREQLQARVEELEDEVREREADLKRFRSELGKANHRLETLITQLHGELKLAHVIQKALVPTEFPHIAGFEFSTKFVPSSVQGGDYFDIFEHEDRFRFGVIVSSSSGHSMSALLLSVLLKMTSQLEAKRGSEPHQVLLEMLDQLKANMSEEDQSDIFYALIDRRNYEMRYVRAGQVVALHQNAATGEVQALDSSLGPLALDLKPPLQSQALLLNPRDRVVFCTRGVSEARNAEGEAYGLERVTRSFLGGPKRGVHELRNHMLYDVSKFAGLGEPGRDQTLVVLEVKDKVIKLAKS